jgi:hypothetical protein
LSEEVPDPHEHVRRLAAGDDRPFRDYHWPQLQRVLDEEPDEIFTVLAVVCECRIRVRNNPNSRASLVLDRGEPLLQELIAFEFPDEPDAQPGAGELESTATWPRKGLLAAMGYRVGSNDPGRGRRRDLLTRVFSGPLISVVSHEYMAEWGRDRTVARLSKLAWSIASFANNRLRALDGRPDEAVLTWREDLEWLRVTFYEDHFGFPWPSIEF